MDTPGSDSTADSTDTSTSDSSSDGSPSAQIMTSLAETPVSNLIPTSIDDGDSASDVSMSAETDDEDDELPQATTIYVNSDIRIPEQSVSLVEKEPPSATSNKRKHSEPMEDTADHHIINGIPQGKRLKPDGLNEKYKNSEGHLRQDKSLLPAEIWHHIFTFIPPRTLGLLLRVNKSFNAYLDPSSPDHSITPLSKSTAQILKPDAIWRASRRLFWPGMPVPLQGKSELDMWKLACAFSCQFCGKKQPIQAMSSDKWHPGPGENGIIPIWSFGVTTCGPCLQSRSLKEIDLFLSSSVPSQLMAALPFVFFTNELHVLPLTTVQSGQPPQAISIAKVFFQPQLDDIQREFTNVKDMGTATAEEWFKGLEDRGRERRNDSARWEKWEATGGITRMQFTETHEAETVTAQSNGSGPGLATTNIAQSIPSINGHLQTFQNQNPPYFTTQSSQQHSMLPQAIHTSFPTNGPPRFDSPAQNGIAAYPRTYPQARHERSKEEVAELKAARRAEIERRCMLLDPPLIPSVLAHMGSFQAAIQIIQPLNDGAWEVLKPRLLSQREDAEQREKERIAQTRVVQEQMNSYPDVQLKSESKDPFDREWDIQAPLRARIGGYADETIRDGWAGGNKVSKDNCSAFAAEVLIYVRKRFYAEVAKDDAALRATGREPEMDPPDGPSTRKLTLENMKWVFDTKIKPHTEQYRKELFLCNDCDISKHYGFEGVIQHYAAKHTNTLSMGSIVVHWKSEWPEYPPFNPEPSSGKNSYYAAAPSASIPYTSTAPQQSYGYGGYQAAVSAPLQGPNPHVYQESPGPYYGHPQYAEQYSGHQNGPYAPPQPYQDPAQSYQTPQYSAPPVATNLGFNEPSQGYNQPAYGTQYPTEPSIYYNPPEQVSSYPSSGPEVVNQQPYAPQGGQYGYSYTQPPAPQPTQFTQPPPKSEEYKTQLLDVAKNARDVWDTINGLKDVPGSVKVFTIIFHVLKRSRFRFPEDPPLSMIVDGLSSNKDMRKVRNINGLLCKACALGMAGSSSASQKKHMSFPQLVSHFHTIHEQGPSQNDHAHIPDWTKDMVELPDITRLSSVANAQGMTDQKLKLIAEAIPEIFASPQDTVDHKSRAGSSSGYAPPADQTTYSPPPSKDNHDKYYTTIDDGRPTEHGSGTYDSTQYDPRNPHDLREPQIPEDTPPRYKVLRRADDYYPATYQDRQERSYAEPRVISPVSQVRLVDGYSRVVVREEPPPVYLDERPRYRDDDDIEYRVRRAPPTLAYDDLNPMVPERDYRDLNTQAYQSHRREVVYDPPPRETRYRPAEDVAAQQNRIYDVVAQISQQAKQGREKPVKDEPGSEDGELRAPQTSKPDGISSRTQQSTEASNAAERFLNEFLPGENITSSTNKHVVTEMRPLGYENGHGDNVSRTYQTAKEPQRRTRNEYEEDERVVSSRSRLLNSAQDGSIPNGYVVRDRTPQPRQSLAYQHDERYRDLTSEQPVTRERSPELVDRRFKLNNVVYRDERQGSHGMHRTPSSRYARYESVRLENDRARSRSPIYVKMGTQPGQYHERSPAAHPSHQEPIYRTRTPQVPMEELTYERAPRQEYYRVEPQTRHPQYVETFEYVRVSDPQGDYMIRRPIRREAEPIYYEGDQYTRKPVYESRAAPPRSEPAYYEEYDPRHPAPPPTTAGAPVREVRYQ